MIQLSMVRIVGNRIHMNGEDADGDEDAAAANALAATCFHPRSSHDQANDNPNKANHLSYSTPAAICM